MNPAKSHTLTNLSNDQLIEMNEALDQSVIIAITDEHGVIQSVNELFCKISKYTPDELIGQDHKLLNSSFHPKAFFRLMWNTISSGKTWKGDICNKAKDGSIYWVKTTIVPIINEQGETKKYISIRTDITAQKKIKQIYHQMHHDELTSLPNRRSLTLDLEKLMTITQDNRDTHFALILFDINRFKIINDSLGYSAGDHVLQSIAQRFTRLHSKHTSFYRLSSDKFVCVHRDFASTKKMIKQIMLIFDKGFQIEDLHFYLNASVGVAYFPEHSLHPEHLIKCADSAMNQIKLQNSHNYNVYSPKSEPAINHDLILEAKLHAAVKYERFELHYQPKFDLKRNKLIGMEALIRWNDAELGAIRPDLFIPIAEECGLISQIGEWVTKTAGLQVKLWNKQFSTNLKVSINISPLHLARYNYISSLKAIIKKHQLDASMLEIEITEQSMLDQTPALLDKIKKIKKMGITIAIDDFGMGYSSLSYLKKFPVDILKIDRFFIKNLNHNLEDEAMVSAIISLAHALNLNVVAEGVENETELAILRKHRCEYVQGFIYSRPLSVTDFEQKLANCP